MTDRIDALTIILDKPMRDDDIASLVAALKQMRGVLEVTPYVRNGLNTAIAEQRIRHEFRQKVLQVLEPPLFGWPIDPEELQGVHISPV